MGIDRCAAPRSFLREAEKGRYAIARADNGLSTAFIQKDFDILLVLDLPLFGLLFRVKLRETDIELALFVCVFTFDTGVFAFDIGVLAFDTGVFDFDVGVLAFDTGVFGVSVFITCAFGNFP